MMWGSAYAASPAPPPNVMPSMTAITGLFICEMRRFIVNSSAKNLMAVSTCKCSQHSQCPTPPSALQTSAAACTGVGGLHLAEITRCGWSQPVWAPVELTPHWRCELGFCAVQAGGYRAEAPWRPGEGQGTHVAAACRNHCRTHVAAGAERPPIAHPLDHHPLNVVHLLGAAASHPMRSARR